MASSQPPFQKGDRVWLLPDGDRREIRTKLPGIVAEVMPDSGRIRVAYMDMGCGPFVKTVQPKRLEARTIPSLELKRKGYES
jgi:hypothetical protein